MFKNAITRTPCLHYSEGITTANLGSPDFQLVLRQHEEYVRALQLCGLDVEVLPADESFPDSCFVEDTAVIIPEAAIITNPGAPSRRGEINSIQPVLARYKKLEFIQAPGTLEGGDVLQVNRHFYIGLTERTNEAGAWQLGSILQQYGYTFTLITMNAALHLKTVVNYIGNNFLLASSELAAHPAFSAYNKIIVDTNDLYAANCLLINEKLIMPAAFNTVKSLLQQAGFDPIEIPMTEFEKMDGGLTCLSLRY